MGPAIGTDSGANDNPSVAIVDAQEQTRRIKAAVARRAFKLSERRGFIPGHEVEDWRQAESQLVRSPCYGRMTIDDRLWVGTDASAFEEGTIQIWVAPRRLTICGKPHNRKLNGQKQIGPLSDEQRVFRVIELPADIDPCKVRPRIKRQFLEIFMTKVKARVGLRAIAA